MGRPKKYHSEEERRRAKQLSNARYREHLKDRQRGEKTKGQNAAHKCVHKGLGSNNGGLMPQYSEFDFKHKVEQYFEDADNGLRPVIIPTMLDLAVYLDVSYQTLLNYKNRDGLYLEAFNRAWDRCESALEQLLYREKGNPNGPLAVLNYRHNRNPRQEISVKTEGVLLEIQSMTDPELDQFIKARLSGTTYSGLLEASTT